MTGRFPAASLLAAALFLPAVNGCGRASPAAPPHPGQKVSWDEYRKMDAEQKDDPYVLDNLDNEARRKLAELQRKKK
jgi:hypothetical protein